MAYSIDTPLLSLLVVAFRALAQSLDLLGVLRTERKSNRFVCVVDFSAAAQFGRIETLSPGQGCSQRARG